MNFFLGVFYFSILITYGEFKSVDTSNGANRVHDEITKFKTGEKISQKDLELQELKDNIGKVGNKLEGIIYEVLKDFLSQELESEEAKSKNNDTVSVTNVLLKKYHPKFFQNPDTESSVIEDEVLALPETTTTPDGDIPTTQKLETLTKQLETFAQQLETTTNSDVQNPSTENRIDYGTPTDLELDQLIYDYEVMNHNRENLKTETQIVTDTPPPQTTPLESLITTATTQRTRRRRMVGNASDNRMEANPEAEAERPEIVIKKFENDNMEQPIMMRTIQIPEDVPRRHPVGKNEKRRKSSEHEEGRKRKTSQDENRKEIKDSIKGQVVNQIPETSDDVRVGQSFQWQPAPTCYEKNGREDVLEKQHIEDLKYEVNKLRSVVDLLREQQRLINSMDNKQMNEHDMLDVLNQLNSKDNTALSNKNGNNEIETINKAKHEDLQQIKIQLQEAIENLNRSKEILNLEHKKELDLEQQLDKQKTEINWLKLIMENFIISQTKTKIKQNSDDKNIVDEKKVNETENHIVGSVLHRNRTVPSTVRMAQEKLMEKSRESTHDSRMRSSLPRANEFSALGKLLDSISDKQSKSDDDDAFQLKLLEAVSELKKKKEKDHFAKNLLKKLQDGGGLESKSEDDDLNQLLKIQKALKSLDSPQSKNDDFDIDDQLKLLQKEIGKLRPNDELGAGFFPETKGPADDPIRFQAMLNKLIANNPQLQGTKLPPITPQQLMQLQNKFQMRPGIIPEYNPGTGAWNGYSSGLGKLGYGTKYGAYGKDLDYSALYSAGSDYSKPVGYGSVYSGGNGYPGLYSGNLGYNPGYLSGYSGPSYVGYTGYNNPKIPYSGTNYPSNYSPAPYKPKDVNYPVNPYSAQPIPYSSPNVYGPKPDQYIADKQNYGGNNFFQVPQPSTYGSGPPTPYGPPKTPDASSVDKLYGPQSTYPGLSAPYAGEKIEDLKTQIYGLQNAINSYNRPEYTQTPEDKNTIYNLEQQIDELKSIVNTLNSYPGDQPSGVTYEGAGYNPSYPLPDPYGRNSEKRSKRSLQNPREPGMLERLSSAFRNAFMDDNTRPDDKSRIQRSVQDNAITERRASGVLDKLTSALEDVLDDSSSSTDVPASSIPVFRQIPTNPTTRTSSNQLSRPNKHATLQDIEKQIVHLRKQLGQKNSNSDSANTIMKDIQTPVTNQILPFSARHSMLPETDYGAYPYYNNYGPNLVQFPKDLTLKPKKLEVFKKIVSKIMDKVIESMPVILHKLFGFAVHELTAYGGDNYGGYGSDGGVLNVFRNLGVFGYLPIILLRILNAVSSFIHILQKNKFLKYFLIPAAIVLAVSGSMVFLIWWMQPSDYYINYEKSYDKDYASYGYDNQIDYGKSSGQITKSYDDGKDGIRSYNPPEAKPPMYAPNVVYPQFYKPKETQFIQPMPPNYVE